MNEVLTIVLKGDGTGLTGTLRTGSGEVRTFSAELDKAGKQSEVAAKKIGDMAKNAGDAVNKALRGNIQGATEDVAMLGTRGATSFGLLGAAITGAAAAAALFAAAQVKGYQETRELQRAVAVTGNTIGETVGRLADMRNEIGRATGEYGKAQAAVAGLTREAKLSGSAFADAASSAVNLAKLSGDSIESITAKMSRNADEPAKLMRSLNDEYHFLTAAVYSQVRALEEQGREQDALALGFDALEEASRERTRQMEEQAGALETAWHKVKGAVLGVWQAMKDVGREDAEYQYQQESQQLRALQDSNRKPDGTFSAGAQRLIGEQRERVNGALVRLMDEQSNAARTRGEQLRQSQGVAAIDEIDKWLERGKNKAQQLAKVKADIDKQFNALRAANPDDPRLAGVTFGAGGISGGAYDQSVAAANEKFRDKGAERAASAAQAKEQREAARADELRTRTLGQLNDAIDKQAALYSGPVEKANSQYAIQLRDLDEKERKLADAHRLDAEMQGKLREARDAASAAHERDLLLAQREQEELGRRADIVGSMLADYANETAAIGMTSRQREIHAALLDAEREARRLYADGLRDSITLTDEETAAIGRGIGVMYDRAVAMENWSSIATAGIDNVGTAFGDLIGSGLRDWDRFGDDLKNITKNFLADIATEFAQQQWLEPLKENVTDWLSGVMNGNGFAAGGKNIGGNWMQSISNWAGSLFGGGTTAAAGVNGYGAGWLNGGTWAGLGSAATGAGGGATGAAGGAAAGAGGMASAIPIIGWIVAGMMANSDLYKKGWSVEGQEMDILKSAMKGTALGVPLFGPGAVGAMGGVMLADKTLQALGLDGKTASMLSGSSILAKAFGRKAPQVQGQGISGSYGFDGLDGRSFADIKQKGGWFRSDKKWTQYSALDSDIDMAFDAAATGVRTGATALAKQLGIDVSAQLARVRVDIGKMTLDKDSEIAKQQLEKAVSDMMERLSKEAVKALGFASLLDDGFAATDTMTALSSVLELVDGNAAKATQGMEYLQRQANELGTDLAAQAERIGGLLGEYGSLIGDVDAQLRTAGLNEFQMRALEIETAYRQQVTQANDLAKALGLSGARSEDLAKIEQLRAVNMGKLTAEMERQRNSILDGLALSEFAPSTDAQKLSEAMSQLQAAVSSGDVAGAGALAQSALGLGRNLYASGNDYNALYGQVTGMIGGMGMPELDMADGTTMGDLADILLETPKNIAQELFALLYTPTTAPGTGNSTTGGNLPGNGGLGGPDVDRTLREILDELRTGNRDAATAKLRETLNARATA